MRRKGGGGGGGGGWDRGSFTPPPPPQPLNFELPPKASAWTTRMLCILFSEVYLDVCLKWGDPLFYTGCGYHRVLQFWDRRIEENGGGKESGERNDIL